MQFVCIEVLFLCMRGMLGTISAIMFTSILEGTWELPLLITCMAISYGVENLPSDFNA